MKKFLIIALCAFAPFIAAMQHSITATRHITNVINNSGKEVSIRVKPDIMQSSFIGYAPENIAGEATSLETYTEGAGQTYSIPATPVLQTVNIPANPDGDDIIDVSINGVKVETFATADLADHDYTVTINTLGQVTIS